MYRTPVECDDRDALGRLIAVIAEARDVVVAATDAMAPRAAQVRGMVPQEEYDAVRRRLDQIEDAYAGLSIERDELLGQLATVREELRSANMNRETAECQRVSAEQTLAACRTVLKERDASLVAAALDLDNARKERDEAVAANERLLASVDSERENNNRLLGRLRAMADADDDESTMSAVARVVDTAKRLQAERDGVQLGTYITPAEAMAAALERERIARVLTQAEHDADARRAALAKADNYLAANTQQEWVFALRYGFFFHEAGGSGLDVDVYDDEQCVRVNISPPHGAPSAGVWLSPVEARAMAESLLKAARWAEGTRGEDE